MQTKKWAQCLSLSLLVLASACGVTTQEELEATMQAIEAAPAAAAPVAKDPVLNELPELEPGLAPDGWSQQSERLAPTLLAMNPNVSESGFISLSVDGLGTNSPSGIIQVQKPAGATVRRAFMAAASTGFTSYIIPNGGVAIDGVGVTWSQSIANSISSRNHWAEVTNMVKPKIDAAAAGRVNFTITESNTTLIDGAILAVIFNDPSTTTVNTVILLFGAQSTTGDTFNITLAEPINKNDPNLKLDLSLGISYGYQSGSTNETQRSIVNINNVRLTSQAGGQDDGEAANGALITVGGLDDTNANPPPNATGPGPRGDDELYNMLPLVANGAQTFVITSSNPSNDDNILFAALNLRSAAAVLGEGIVLGPTLATGPTGSTHTLTASLSNSAGAPLPNRVVTFTIASGPNAGLTGTATSNSQGKATFTYTGSGGVGRDDIRASFVKTNGETAVSNSAFMDWTSSNRPPVARCQNLSLSVSGEFCGATGSINNGSSDPDGDAINCVQSPAGAFGLGTTTATLTCTDPGGLSSSCSATVTVEDHIAPTISCPSNREAECVDGGATVDTGLASASDNCGSVRLTDPAPAFYPYGTSTVTHTAVDTSDNLAICTNLVIIRDTAAPFFTSIPGPFVAEYSGPLTPVAVGMATAGDACGVGLSVSSDAPAGFPYGTTTVTFTASDAAGNTATATTTVLIRDTTPPVITHPGILYVEATGPSGASVNYPVSAYDLRDGNVPVICTPPSGSSFPFGPTVVNCMASDSAGNMSTASFTVIVQDTTPPEYVTFPDDINYTAWCSYKGGWIGWEWPTAWDLVDGETVVSCDHQPWELMPLGTTVITCTTSDAAGNTNTRSFNINVTFGWNGFSTPDEGGTYALGADLPVQFTLAGDSTWITDLSAQLYIAPVNGGVVGPETLAGSFSYTWGYGTYDLSLGTGSLSAGQYQLRIEMGDDVVRTRLINLQ